MSNTGSFLKGLTSIGKTQKISYQLFRLISELDTEFYFRHPLYNLTVHSAVLQGFLIDE